LYQFNAAGLQQLWYQKLEIQADRKKPVVVWKKQKFQLMETSLTWSAAPAGEVSRSVHSTPLVWTGSQRHKAADLKPSSKMTTRIFEHTFIAI